MLPFSTLFAVLGVQLIYIVINWYFFRRKEYFFYTVYMICVALYFLNKYLGGENGTADIGVIQYPVWYPDKILAILSYIFYFKFGRYFVEAGTRYPVMNQFMKYAERFLVVYVVADIVLLATCSFFLEDKTFFPVNVAIFISLIYIFGIMVKRNEILDRFILAGSMFYAMSACITMWLGRGLASVETDHIVVLQIGTIVEMIFLNAGLVYKSIMLQNQTIKSQKELIERYEENQELLLRIGNIRASISRDLHDDVGATLSSVVAYSEILIQNPDNPIIADLIKVNSSEMIEKLEVIAWATNPQHDSFRSLKNQMIKYATPICHLQNIKCEIESDGIEPDMLMPGEIRQNTFLVFKEALNNTIKYAGATAFEAMIVVGDHEFVLTVNDNGKGSDGTVRGNGNGWKNMSKRIEAMNGRLKIASVLENGTSISMSIPYPFKLPLA